MFNIYLLLNMKKILLSNFLLLMVMLINAQPPTVRSTIVNPLKVNYQNFSSRKQTLLEKQVIRLGDFKGLTLEKIILKDTSDNSSLSVLGLMSFSETFDQISKKTTILEKEDLSKLLQTLVKLEQNATSKAENETKFKYLTSNNVEVGSVYDQVLKVWNHYLKIPQSMYNQNPISFNTKELKDLIQLLKKAEQTL